MDHGILLETGTNEMELLAILLDDQVFGINVAKVRSIQQFERSEVTPLPDAAEGIMGVLLNRGSTFPLIDLATILGRQIRINPKDDKGREIIVVTEFNNSVNSFKVDGVLRIYRLSWSQFVPLSEMLENNSYITGSVNIDDTEILVLDLEYILSTLFPDLVLEDVSDEVIKQKEEISRNNIKLFFAEDSSMMRKSVLKMLIKSGFEDITDFENGKLAYEYITANWARIEGANRPIVLISDIEMPQMDGLTLCNKLKSDPETTNIHIIMFSSLINKQMLAKCKSVKANNYITKPETMGLIAMLDDVCKSANE